MSLFSKKKKEPAPQPPPVQQPIERDPRTETILKLNLPDVFAFQEDATKANLRVRGPAAETAAPPTQRRESILLVETDEELRRLLSRLLSHEGFELRTATCLAEARTMLTEIPADYVLARRACAPLNLQAEIAVREIRKTAMVRIVDDFNQLILGQVVDYESLAGCFLTLTDLLLSLLESQRPNARGHAHTVTKYCRLVGQRLGMRRRDLDTLTLAATLHDLGALEMEQRISEIKLDPALSLPAYQATLDLLANIVFPYPVHDLLAATPEPGAVPDAELPLLSQGTRVLRVVDTYETLRRTKSGQFSEEEAVFEWMRRQPTGTFDTEALETLIHIRKHERAISAMSLFTGAALLVDPHPEELQSLKLRLENDEFRIHLARHLEEALQKLRTENITVVLTERHLGQTGDGFALLGAIKTDPALRHIPVIFHAAPDIDQIRQALEQGAEDWFAKPHNVEIAAIKLQRLCHRAQSSLAAAEGVQGNLRDLGLLEMVQILCNGGRSVSIQLERENDQAELMIQNGQLLTAKHGSHTGEAAALAVLAWRHGQFRLRPLKQAPVPNITSTTDSLLLEHCRLEKNAKPATAP